MRVLIADDDNVSLSLLARHLAKLGHQISTAGDGNEALALLNKGGLQLAIVDWMMPGLDGAELCRIVRNQPSDAYIYILLLTGKNSTSELVEGLDAGADDYMVKPVNLRELEARLRCGQRIITLHTQLIEAREQLRIQAMRDALTGLWNRGAIFDLARGEYLRTARAGTDFAVLLCDIDHFKRLNDTYGHLAGDRALREVAQRIRNSVRTTDFVGRYGGEEFLIALPCSDEVQTAEVAQRVCQAVRTLPVQIGETACTISISIGTAVRTVGSTREFEELVNLADMRLLTAKRNGRNQVVTQSGDTPKLISGNPKIA